MDKNAYNIYSLDETKEKDLWKECVFVFDTSVLIDFYSMTSESLQSLKKIYGKVNGRLMLPNHVQYEYLKKRKSLIDDKCMRCSKLKSEYLDNISASNDTILEKINELEKKVKQNKNYPSLDTGFINTFREKAEDFKLNVANFKIEFERQIQAHSDNLSDTIVDDPVMDLIDKSFVVGRAYDFQEIMRIVEEGKLRYEFMIPPGYGDIKKGNGTQIFGDLIIWKQIIEYAMKEKSSIVLITNDIGKGDWCEIDSRKRITRPHNDLIKEINDASGKRFWMYTLEQFLYFSNEYLNVNVPDDQIEQAYGIISHKYDLISVSFRCDRCGTVNKQSIDKNILEYELIESHERQMGHERRYEAEAFLYCTKCSQEVFALLSVWEYPEDCTNLSEIELSGSDLISYDQFTRDCIKDRWDDICANMYAEEMYNLMKGK